MKEEAQKRGKYKKQLTRHAKEFCTMILKQLPDGLVSVISISLDPPPPLKKSTFKKCRFISIFGGAPPLWTVFKINLRFYLLAPIRVNLGLLFELLTHRKCIKSDSNRLHDC